MQYSTAAVVRFPDPSLSPAQLASSVDGLVDALGSERRLVEELIAIMRRQRDAVAHDDLQTVDDSVYAIQRVLFTLGEARKRRRALNRRVSRSDELPLGQLESLLGDAVTPEFRTAREALQGAARTLANEVAVNRRLLREALAAGDDYARALYGIDGSRAHTPAYGVGAQPAATAAAGGQLLNRRA
jgi:hypothetical protein